jgi:hypothetical protein
MINIINKIKTVVDTVVRNKIKKGLLFNDSYETWMVTKPRKGFRIEMQAFLAIMYKLLFILTGNSFYQSAEKDLKKKVKKHFTKNGQLIDGIKDSEILPNIFLAAYIFPELLTHNQWSKSFDKILPKLWLSWGGISTKDIKKKSKKGKNHLFIGESWFWLNHCTALVLHRMNKKKYTDRIKKIIKSASKEILWQGIIGHHTTMSDQKRLSSMHPYISSISSAFFIELLSEA